MRDGLLSLGTITLATAGAQVGSEYSIDLAALATAFTKDTNHQAPRGPAFMVFQLRAALSSGETIDVSIQDSADNSTYADVIEMTASTKTAAGVFIRLPLPVEHRRYIRGAAIGQHGSSFSDAILDCWIEFGANE